jgi:hypothetical protein
MVKEKAVGNMEYMTRKEREETSSGIFILKNLSLVETEANTHGIDLGRQNENELTRLDFIIMISLKFK